MVATGVAVGLALGEGDGEGTGCAFATVPIPKAIAIAATITSAPNQRCIFMITKAPRGFELVTRFGYPGAFEPKRNVPLLV